VAIAGLPALIESVRASVANLAGERSQPKVEAVDKPTAAQIRRSIEPDGIVSFLDGRRYQTLKRHLTKHGLDPKSYREQFGLPSDYPMVASAYSKRRATIARSNGLGVLDAQDARAPRGATS